MVIMEPQRSVPGSQGKGILHPFMSGTAWKGSPGGAPRGKRVSTWMAEYGELVVSEWPTVGSPEFDKLPGNARIALRRLRAADQEEELGLANSKYVEPREVATGPAPDSQALVAGIALAIQAMIAAGVVIPEPAQVIDTTAQGTDDDIR